MLTNASAGSLPYRDGVFDIVFCSRFLHLFPNEAYPELVGEMARVLRPGGYLVIEMKNQWYGIGLHWAQGRLRAAGGARPPSSCVDLRYLPALGRQVGGLRLLRSYGLLLPKGWWVMDRPRLARAVRALARGPLKPLSAHLVAVYRRD
jgi:ubiquinone/menaquinone biosynthesis C-methylase UbiE